MINIILLVAVVVAGMGIYRAYREYKVPVTRARGRWALVLQYRFELLIVGAAALGSLWGQEYPALIAFAVLLPVLTLAIGPQVGLPDEKRMPAFALAVG